MALGPLGKEAFANNLALKSRLVTIPARSFHTWVEYTERSRYGRLTTIAHDTSDLAGFLPFRRDLVATPITDLRTNVLQTGPDPPKGFAKGFAKIDLSP